MNVRTAAVSTRAWVRTLVASVAWCVAVCAPAVAHPLGNFTINHLSRISVNGPVIGVRYVLDLAEIPTVAVESQLGGGRPTGAALQRWARERATSIGPALALSADGTQLPLTVQDASAVERTGAAGLRTIYLRVDYRAQAARVPARLHYVDGTYPGRLGWKDVVVAPAREPTHELRVYPSALVGSPRNVTDAGIIVDARGRAHAVAGAAPVHVAASPSLARMNDMTGLLRDPRRDIAFVLGALLISIVLGALHALEPGHGKTLLAVSLVGARATAGQAVILATALTFAHTVGVVALGALVLGASAWLVPEAVYPWITLASGAFVAFLGARALAAQVRRRRPVVHVHVHAHDGAHPHTHDHAHGLGTHEHPHADEMRLAHDHADLDDEAHARAHAVGGSAPLTFRTAILAAAGGNLAPCPAALMVLLGAVAAGRIAFGLALVVAFSIGLALTLTVLGLAVVRGAAWLSSRPLFNRIAASAPLISAVAIALVGAVMLAEGLLAQGIPGTLPLLAGLAFAAMVGYAFTAPHRHSGFRTLVKA